MKPFHYPENVHTRTQKPLQYNNYKKYKPYLREEFGKACIYCRKPDSLGDLDAFGVDHYRPKKKYPNLETDYSNLFYSCNTCNRRKGEFWPTHTQVSNGQFVPNPCDYVMHQHLRSEPNGTVAAHSPAGTWTIDLLRLNEEERLNFRRAIIAALEHAISLERKLINTLAQIDLKLGSVSAKNRDKLLSMKKEHKNKLEDVRNNLRTLGA